MKIYADQTTVQPNKKQYSYRTNYSKAEQTKTLAANAAMHTAASDLLITMLTLCIY